MPDEIRDPHSKDMHIGPDHQLPAPKRSTSLRIVVWLIILVAFGLLFWWVMHRRSAPAAAGGRGRRGAAGGTVTVTRSKPPPRATSASTSTPSAPSPRYYTDTVVSQVTGVITEVLYREGQMVRTRASGWCRSIPRPYAANRHYRPGATRTRQTPTCSLRPRWT